MSDVEFDDDDGRPDQIFSTFTPSDPQGGNNSGGHLAQSQLILPDFDATKSSVQHHSPPSVSAESHPVPPTHDFRHASPAPRLTSPSSPPATAHGSVPHHSPPPAAAAPPPAYSTSSVTSPSSVGVSRSSSSFLRGCPADATMGLDVLREQHNWTQTPQGQVLTAQPTRSIDPEPAPPASHLPKPVVHPHDFSFHIKEPVPVPDRTKGIVYYYPIIVSVKYHELAQHTPQNHPYVAPNAPAQTFSWTVYVRFSSFDAVYNQIASLFPSIPVQLSKISFDTRSTGGNAAQLQRRTMLQDLIYRLAELDFVPYLAAWQNMLLIPQYVILVSSYAYAPTSEYALTGQRLTYQWEDPLLHSSPIVDHKHNPNQSFSSSGFGFSAVCQVPEIDVMLSAVRWNENAVSKLTSHVSNWFWGSGSSAAAAAVAVATAAASSASSSGANQTAASSPPPTAINNASPGASVPPAVAAAQAAASALVKTSRCDHAKAYGGLLVWCYQHHSNTWVINSITTLTSAVTCALHVPSENNNYVYLGLLSGEIAVLELGADIRQSVDVPSVEISVPCRAIDFRGDEIDLSPPINDPNVYNPLPSPPPPAQLPLPKDYCGLYMVNGRTIGVTRENGIFFDLYNAFGSTWLDLGTSLLSSTLIADRFLICGTATSGHIIIIDLVAPMKPVISNSFHGDTDRFFRGPAAFSPQQQEADLFSGTTTTTTVTTTGAPQQMNTAMSKSILKCSVNSLHVTPFIPTPQQPLHPVVVAYEPVHTHGIRYLAQTLVDRTKLLDSLETTSYQSFPNALRDLRLLSTAASQHRPIPSTVVQLAHPGSGQPTTFADAWAASTRYTASSYQCNHRPVLASSVDAELFSTQRALNAQAVSPQVDELVFLLLTASHDGTNKILALNTMPLNIQKATTLSSFDGPYPLLSPENPLLTIGEISAGPSHCAAWLGPDSLYFVTAHDSGSSVKKSMVNDNARLYLWNIATMKHSPLWATIAHKNQIMAIEWNAKTHEVMTASRDGTLKIWALQTLIDQHEHDNALLAEQREQ